MVTVPLHVRVTTGAPLSVHWANTGIVAPLVVVRLLRFSLLRYPVPLPFASVFHPVKVYPALVYELVVKFCAVSYANI